MEYYIKYQGWFVQVVSYVIWIDQCVKHEIDDKYFATLHGYVCSSLFYYILFLSRAERSAYSIYVWYLVVSHQVAKVWNLQRTIDVPRVYAL